ncbi:MAG: TIGR01212 family radical SAM protein [Candidatus Altiarchaeota archaeon]|nr:TIGR01212 family radical SAM protein [Candidatus Altiarchaeota archaeon]
MKKHLVDKRVVDSMYKTGSLYSAFGEYWRRKYGYNVCKVPLNAKVGCPNWDGRISKEGCIFCPDFARQFTYDSFRTVMDKGVKAQVAHQVKHYTGMGAGEKALVYIAFGTNTYMPLKDFKELCDQALDHKDVVGLSIGTRPDCLPDGVLDILGDYAKQDYKIWLEIGQQTVHLHTLESIKRGHGFAEAIRVVREAHKRDIPVLFFTILGLPYETPSEMRETARILSALEVDAVKLYPLIVMKKTQLANQYLQGRYRPLGLDEYVGLLADFLENLSPYVLIQRLSKDCGLETKLAPEWNSYRLIVGPRVEKELKARGAKQGDEYKITLDESELVDLG